MDRKSAFQAESPPFFSISLISAAILGYEVLLIRLFSIIQWHHFAYMIISLALLGYGASGTFLALSQRALQGHFVAAYVGNAAFFGLFTTGCFLLAQQVPFNPLEIPWDFRQPLWLLGIYLLLFVPFFCAANCICLAFSRFHGRIHRIYCFDLLGAGAGAPGILVLLFIFSPVGTLKILSALGLAAAALACLECGVGARWPATLLLVCAISLPAVLPGRWIALKPSEYKALSQALYVQGARILDEKSSPLGLITVVESPLVPFRYAPGLSLNSPFEPLPQLGIFTDGDSFSAITKLDGGLEKLAYLDYQTLALPYHLLDHPMVLTLGAGGGADILLASYHLASHIDAVEINPQVVDLVRQQFADFAGGLYSANRVDVHVAEAREFVAGNHEQYDLIQLGLLDSFSASSAGLYALTESYLYTVEAFQEYIRNLRPGGILAITRWIKLPPRDSLKLFATAATALEFLGVKNPEQRLALIRSWNTSTLVVKNGALTAKDVAAIRAFCKARWFDVAYAPGMEPSEANTYNVLEEPYFFDGAMALLGEGREAFLARYKFDLTPSTDDRPYFFNFFKWRALPELLSIRGRAGLPLLEWGYLVLIGTLAQAVLASLALVLFPLCIYKPRKGKVENGQVRLWSVVVYFLAIGLAFMFIEIAFIQKFILFLGHPLYAAGVVLCGFLVFAGLGSGYSGRLERMSAERMPSFGPLSWAAASVAIISLFYVVLLPPLFQRLIALPDTVKILISLALIAPLAFCMGMPFPLGLSRLAQKAQQLIPWAWGVNGCASVLSAILATILAIHFGFTVVICLALALYASAVISYVRD